jgi:hypothetical protein
MGYFFIDIETFIDPEQPESGLNPYLKNSKILSVAYNYYDEFHLGEKHITPPTILKEWELSEVAVLNKIYTFLKLKIEKDKNIKLMGFNNLKFDMTYLFGRLIQNKIASPEEIYDVFYRKPHYIDLGQLSQIISNHRFKDILNIGQKQANGFFGLPEKNGSGKDVTKFYLKKEYDKIEQYIKEEFTFELLYIRLRRHIYSKKTMVKDGTGENKGSS